MKLVFALTLLIASVTVFSGTAKALPIDNELQQLDILLNLDQGSYSLDELVSRIREGFQVVLDQVKEKLGQRKELFEQFRAKIEEVQQKIRDLVKQGSAKLQEKVRNIREKLQALIKAVFDKIKNRGSLYGTELAEEEEDETIQENFLTKTAERIRAIAEKVVVALKAKLAESKELFGEFKERLDEVTAELAELGKKTGKKALEAARALRDKVGELAQVIIKRTKDQISGSLYTEAEKKEDQSIRELIEKQLRQIAERVRAVVQRVLDTLKEKLGESKELVAKFGERIEAIKNGLRELTKKGAEEALQALAELRRKVLDLARAITGGDFLYESAVYADPTYDKEMIDRIKARIADLVKNVLERVEESFKGKPTGKSPELENLIVELKKAINKDDPIEKFVGQDETGTDVAAEDGLFHKDTTNAKAFEVIRNIRETLAHLVKKARGELNVPEPIPPFYASYDLRDALIAIRDIVTQPAGLQKLKVYLNNLQTSHPTVALVRAYVQSSSDDALIEILKEFFSGFDGINLADFPVTDLAELFGTVRKEILTDAGVQKLRDYAKNIESSHPVVSKIKSALETRPTDAIRAFLGELFSGLNF